MTCVYPANRELKYGIPVMDENGNRLGESASAAKQAIVQVVVSRIGMAVPAMGNGNFHSNKRSDVFSQCNFIVLLSGEIFLFGSLAQFLEACDLKSQFFIKTNTFADLS